MTQEFFLTKFTSPSLGKIVLRRRLFDLLNVSAPTSAIWLSGPGGCGKSTLIASYLSTNKIPHLWYQMDTEDGDLSTFFYYLKQATANILDPPEPALPLLTPEYQFGLETFFRRYFENLFLRLKRPFWMVLDNFQEVPADSKIHQALLKAIELLPDGIKIAIVSRTNPLSLMARLQANRKVRHIGWNNLAFTSEELREVVDLLGRIMWSDHHVKQLYEITQGWIAGVILWLLCADFSSGTPEFPSESTPETIFDYFGTEVLQNIDNTTKDFLLKTSFLNEITTDTANQLVEFDRATEIIQQLGYDNFFLEKLSASTPMYRYHPLFLNFLNKQAERHFSKEALNNIRCRAAKLSVKHGALDHAVTLFVEAEAWDKLIELIQIHAYILFFQGRPQILSKWISYLPQNLIDNNSWMLLWQGVGLLPYNPFEGRKLCTHAYHKFCKSQDIVGQMLSFSASVESFFLSRSEMQGLDFWIEQGEIIEPYLSYINDLQICGRFSGAMLGALAIRAPAHPSIGNWINRCTTMMHESDDLSLHIMFANFLVLIHCWHGRVNNAKIILQWLEPAIDKRDVFPMQRIMFNVIQFVYFQASGESRRCKNTVESILELSEETGVKVYDGLIYSHATYASFVTGDLFVARQYLKKMAHTIKPHETVDIAHYHGLCAWESYAAGNLSLALSHIKTALELGEANGAPVATAISARLFEVRLLLASGAIGEAQRLLDRISGSSRAQGCILIEFQELLTKAQFFYSKKDATLGIRYLKEAFQLSRENGIFDANWWLHSELAFFCQKAMEADVEIEQVKRFIEQHQLIPEKPHSAAIHWNWLVKIYTMGCFKVIVNDQPLTISSKTPKKLFELLRLLICQSQKGINRDTLTDQLWPDTDGDRAIQSINTTLYRLRKLIGNDQVVIMNNNRLELNSKLCWVDTWYFEALLEQSESVSDLIAKKDYLEKALSLYKGAFEYAEAPSTFIFSYSQKLKEQWLKAVIDTSKILSDIGHMEKAINILQQALVIDNAAEPIYQSLMYTLNTQGRTAEALLAFNNCRSILSAEGLEPSNKTIALFHSLQAARKSKNRQSS
ncbi:MAG: winged helix-turn-helix domain-containing protein [Proteobacteria bacterium]|nr:winged helix-turn-helix domain-containing protein [Pseudomonadota bacterium]